MMVSAIILGGTLGIISLYSVGAEAACADYGGTENTASSQTYCTGAYSAANGGTANDATLSIANSNYATLVAAGLGYGNSITVSGNEVDVTGTTVLNQSLFGGYSFYSAATGNFTAGDAVNNTVNIGGSARAANVYGGFSSTSATTSGTTVGGQASNNTVIIGGAALVTSVTGGRSGATGTNASSNDANGNTVIVEGTATVIGSVQGGYTFAAGIGGAAVTKAGNASGNTVIIKDSATVTGSQVAGGYSHAGSTNRTQGDAINNIIQILGTPSFSTNTIFYGGYSSAVGGDVRTGNRLEIGSLGLNVKGIANFQNLYFYLPSTIKTGDTVLSVTDAVDISTPSGKGATTVGVGVMGGGTPLAVGNTVTLIRSANSLTADIGLTNTITGMVGISKSYEFSLETTATELLARVTRAPVSDEGIVKSPSEGVAASFTQITQGADMIVNMGIDNALSATRGRGLIAFGAGSGGMSRYSTGSHVNVSGVSTLAGLARRWEASETDIVVGGFFESGFGAYDTYNSKMDGGTVKGSGSSSYYGGGVLMHLDKTDGPVKGLYTEASLRAGSLHNNYHSDDLNPDLGRALYTTNSIYYGAHAGVGYVWSLNERTSLDLYGKYLWAHTGGSNVTILGDPVEFKAVNSHRVRPGARLGYEINSGVTPYVGGAWDYEFNGTARSVVAGESITAPSLRGSTGIGELGVRWEPTHAKDISLDVNLQGYLGKREGAVGSIRVRYEF